MLRITIPSIELFNEMTSEFIYFDEETIELEHSLVSISKWESKWHKPFLSDGNKSSEEILDYVSCMSINGPIKRDLLQRLSNDNFLQINNYINDSMTATTFSQQANKAGREIVTSELVYYWMVALNIPFECQHWHLNRLLTLIKVCNIKNSPEKKMSKEEVMRRNRELNKARRKQLNSSG